MFDATPATTPVRADSLPENPEAELPALSNPFPIPFPSSSPSLFAAPETSIPESALCTLSSKPSRLG